MERAELNVELRTTSGKNEAYRLRTANRIPGVFYGPHQKTAIHLALDAKELSKAIHGGRNTLLTLKAAGGEINGRLALVKDRQVHPVTGQYLHVDLLEVRMDEEINVKIPVVMIGKAKGIADGGILQQVTRILDMRCLPTAVPEKIEVDVTELAIGDSMHVSDISLPEGARVLGGHDHTLAAVVAPEKEEVVATPAADAAAAAAAAPGVAAPGAAPGAAPAAGATAAPGAAPGAAPAAGKGAPAKAEAKKPEKK